MRYYSEDVVAKILQECVSAWEVKDRLAELKDEDCMALDTFSVAEDEVVTLMFPESVPAENVQNVVNYLREVFPDNPIIGILSDMDVLVQNSDDALAMLDGMKAKINIMRGTGATEEKKIIL